MHMLSVDRVVSLLGNKLVEKLAEIESWMHGPVYLAGGTVRDLLIGRKPVDIDVTVERNGKQWAAELARLTGGAFVPLGKEEDAARVVWLGRDIDFSSFREGAEDIEDELRKRDLTVNSLAVSIELLLRRGSVPVPSKFQVIDPVGGLKDLERKIIRKTSDKSFQNDPLRLLRVFRFAATLDFEIDEKTFDLVERQKHLIERTAAERIAYELELIMASENAYESMCDLARSGILFNIIPELVAGVGMEQPASHHLDVFDHSLAALDCMVKVQRGSEHYFCTENIAVLKEYLAKDKHKVLLRWAAFLHDIGKPVTMAIDEERGGRITFYNHDQAGAELVENVAGKLKWSKNDTRLVSCLVGLHMRPFHLGNIQRREEVSLKACLRLVRRVGPDLPGLFLLSMADALAGMGVGRPEEVEKEVATLFARMEKVRHEHVEPVRSGPPLLNGQDLIDELHLEPGPVFRKILDAVEVAHMEKKVKTRQEALHLARSFQGCRKKNRRRDI